MCVGRIMVGQTADNMHRVICQNYLKMPMIPLCILLISVLTLQQATATELRISTASSSIPLRASCSPLKRGWGRPISLHPYCDPYCPPDTFTKYLLWGETFRGGAFTSNEDDSEEEVTSDDESDDDADVEEEEPESESDAEEEKQQKDEEDNSVSVNKDEYDEPLVINPMTQLYATFGVMALSKMIDLYNPRVVRMARYAFIGYLVLLQVFVLFVRVKAKANNDRTPVSVSNPLTNMLQSQLEGQDSGNAMMKNLASSFLSSESTVFEYDLKQAKSMQGGLLFNMGFMWFMHFKMEQIQPMLIQTVTGLMNLVYSPLFQVYIMGRNLERPFKNPAMKQFEEPEQDGEAASETIATTSENEEGEATSSKDDADNEEGETDSEEEEEESDAEDSEHDGEEESESESSDEE